MKNAGVFEAKTHFSQMVEQVLLGETIAITRHGQEVARLVPPNLSKPGSNIKDAILGIKALQKRIAARAQKPDDMSVKDMINWGRE